MYFPTRGWVRIYAEAKVPVSTVRRRDYFSFTAEAQPPPRPEAGLPPLALTMSFAALQRYERRRYERFLPTCYGGVELRRPQGGCLGELRSSPSVPVNPIRQQTWHFCALVHIRMLHSYSLPVRRA